MSAAGDSSERDLKQSMTVTGWDIWQWLVVQPWFKDRPEAKILERKDQGNRYEIVQLCEFPDNKSEKVAVIFFRENEQWKFHDVFLFTMKDMRFDMNLSYVLREPKRRE